MKNILYFVLLAIITCLASCNNREVDLVPGILYSVSTTEGDGYAIFEEGDNHEWIGKFYLDRGRLMAKGQRIEVEVDDNLVLVDVSGKKMPIMSYYPYEEPEYEDYPETWTYQDSVYAVSEIQDVVYGKALGYWVSYPDTGGVHSHMEIYKARQDDLSAGKKDCHLTMDVYLPGDDKTATRPLLVLIHGGAFFNGDKEDIGFPSLARYFAGLGYVVASVNYRLGFRISIGSVKRAGFRAVQDVDAAIRYLIHHNDSFLIDSTRVFVVGTSAGGITALNLAFMREKDIPSAAEEEGGLHSVNASMTERYSVRAVGNCWGAVDDLELLKNAKTAVISFHNIGDPVVPFGKGHPFKTILFLNNLIFPTMYGSEEITRFLGTQRAAIHPYNQEDLHTLHADFDEYGQAVLNSRYDEIKTEMRDFFSARMVSSPIVAVHTENSQIFQLKSPDIEKVMWHVEGGAILRETEQSVEVLMFSDAPSHSVTVSGRYLSGLTFRHHWPVEP